MRISPYTAQAIRKAVTHITAFRPDAANPTAFAAYGVAVTAFSVLESDFVPVGQTDTQLRDDVRRHLAAPPIAPVAEIFRQAITRRGPVGSPEYRDRDWLMLEAMETVDPAAAKLSPIHSRWLLATAYSALIAYGTTGAMLPDAPAELAISVGLVPGDRPQKRFVDEDDEDAAGVPVSVIKRR